MIGKLDEALRFHQTALSLRAERQQVLASNIANADTPNYKARDMDFNGALNTALSKGGPAAKPATPSASPVGGAGYQAVANALVRTSPAHLGGTASGVTASGAQLLYRQTAVQGNIDGNTVDMDVERNQFADNALRYEAGVTFVSGQIKSLLTAIQGQ
jgi:flagellar basal-body rod protein FlgB